MVYMVSNISMSSSLVTVTELSGLVSRLWVCVCEAVRGGAGQVKKKTKEERIQDGE